VELEKAFEKAFEKEFEKEFTKTSTDDDRIVSESNLIVSPKAVANEIITLGSKIQQQYVDKIQQIEGLVKGDLTKLRGLFHKVVGTFEGDSEILSQADKLIDELGSSEAEELRTTTEYKLTRVSEMNNNTKMQKVFETLAHLVDYGQMACMIVQMLQWVQKKRQKRDNELWKDIEKIGQKSTGSGLKRMFH